MELAEIKSIDLCLEHTRTRNSKAEAFLLQSIQERGILDPLLVAGPLQQGDYVLLDGFKRFRSARTLGIAMVPLESVGQDVSEGIVTILRRSSSHTCSIFEEAALLEELHNRYGLSIADMARHLDRSSSWVCMRLGMLDNLSALVREKITTGAFPARTYVYALKSFTRVNGIDSKDLDACVTALSGKKLGTRDLFLLSRAYFQCGDSIKELITSGDLHRALRLIKEQRSMTNENAGTPYDSLISDLKTTVVGMERVVYEGRSNMAVLSAGTALEINLNCALILSNVQLFESTIKELYERTGPSNHGADALSDWAEPKNDCTLTAH
jgi:predicted transcriptional regulator